MSIKLYIDYMSQPSRSVFILCQLNKIPLQIIDTQIVKLDNRTPEYTKINPFKKVPAIVDEANNNYIVYESHAILRYICNSRKINEQWYLLYIIKCVIIFSRYPLNFKEQAEIDKYLDWHHLNLRLNSSGLVFNKILAPLFGLPQKSSQIEQFEKNLHLSLKAIEEIFLQNGKWISGFDKMTIADLICGCELAQLFLVEGFSFEKYPIITKYLLRFFENSTIRNAHSAINNAMESMNPSGFEKFQMFAKF